MSGDHLSSFLGLCREFELDLFEDLLQGDVLEYLEQKELRIIHEFLIKYNKFGLIEKDKTFSSFIMICKKIGKDLTLSDLTTPDTLLSLFGEERKIVASFIERYKVEHLEHFYATLWNSGTFGIEDVLKLNDLHFGYAQLSIDAGLLLDSALSSERLNEKIAKLLVRKKFNIAGLLQCKEIYDYPEALRIFFKALNLSKIFYDFFVYKKKTRISVSFEESNLFFDMLLTIGDFKRVCLMLSGYDISKYELEKILEKRPEYIPLLLEKIPNSFTKENYIFLLNKGFIEFKSYSDGILSFSTKM